MDDKLKEKLVQYQQLGEQLQHFNSFYIELQNKSTELYGIIKALEDIKETPKGKTMLVPISSGIFLNCQISNNEDLIVNVGADVCVKKSVDDTKKLLYQRLEGVEKHMMEVAAVIQQLNELEEQLGEELKGHV